MTRFKLVKRKAEVLEDFENNSPNERCRKLRKTGNEEINTLTWKWFQDATSRRVSISGPLIQRQALKFASELKVDTFHASNGWLSSFLKRHNNMFWAINGESGDVSKSVVEEWKSKLPTICAGFEPKDIFNMDETGLVFRASRNKTLHVKGEACAGGKQSKERLTVALCASMTGEKYKPLVIGKAQHPRCFKNLDIRTLPVQYVANTKAWMTLSFFENWLVKFNSAMKRQERKVLLFLDNAPGHPHLTLSNVTLAFLPANTTSVSQPHHQQGIIQALKLKFRTRQIHFVLDQLEKDKTITGPEVLRKITVLDAIHWLGKAWAEVQESTIAKCFAHAGFTAQPTTSTPDDTEDGSEDDIPLCVETFQGFVW